MFPMFSRQSQEHDLPRMTTVPSGHRPPPPNVPHTFNGSTHSVAVRQLFETLASVTAKQEGKACPKSQGAPCYPPTSAENRENTILDMLLPQGCYCLRLASCSG